MTHVDDFSEALFTDKTTYARFFFFLHRLPANTQAILRPWMKNFRLYCTYEGKKYRVTGASRFGYIWLHSDLSTPEPKPFYEKRVDLDTCSDWSNS